MPFLEAFLIFVGGLVIGIHIGAMLSDDGPTKLS